LLVLRNCLSFLLLDCIHLSDAVRVEKRGAFLDSWYSFAKQLGLSRKSESPRWLLVNEMPVFNFLVATVTAWPENKMREERG
jgi:hypothetical protein